MSWIVIGTLVLSVTGQTLTFQHLGSEPSATVYCPGQTKALSTCQAVQALVRVSEKGIAPDSFRGGKNPGSVLCKLALHGQVELATDPQGNELSLCRFPDGSFASTGSLVAWARANDSQRR
jgi:putative hemolysin